MHQKFHLDKLKKYVGYIITSVVYDPSQEEYIGFTVRKPDADLDTEATIWFGGDEEGNFGGVPQIEEGVEDYERFR